MTLRIDRVEERMRLSGEFRSEHLDQVKAEIERRGSTVVLDLEELAPVDVEAIRFFLMHAKRREFQRRTPSPS